jgi:hypothetical protein
MCGRGLRARGEDGTGSVAVGRKLLGGSCLGIFEVETICGRRGERNCFHILEADNIYTDLGRLARATTVGWEISYTQETAVVGSRRLNFLHYIKSWKRGDGGQGGTAPLERRQAVPKTASELLEARRHQTFC